MVSRRGTRAITVLISICAIVGLAGAMYLLAGATAPTTSQTYQSYHYPASIHDDLTSINLDFTLGLNSTDLAVGQTIGISLSLRNDLDSTNNVTTDDGAFATLPEVSLSACGIGDAPYGILVAHGYYASNNISSATPLALYKPGIYNCPAVFHISSYLFNPLSTTAIFYGGCGQACGSFNASSSLIVAGYWATSSSNSSTFEALSPGVYTVAAVTEWGQIDILHFSVSKS